MIGMRLVRGYNPVSDDQAQNHWQKGSARALETYTEIVCEKGFTLVIPHRFVSPELERERGLRVQSASFESKQTLRFRNSCGFV